MGFDGRLALTTLRSSLNSAYDLSIFFWVRGEFLVMKMFGNLSVGGLMSLLFELEERLF